MEKLEIKNVSMNYHSLNGETTALKDISFNVHESEFLTIVGPSGCGKSTLLNIIAGLLKPSCGKVIVDGKNINDNPPQIGYMFQKDNLFDWLTVWDNVTLGLKIQNSITRQKINKIEDMLKLYNLWEFKNHYPKELSGGMRQRVALIRTLGINPQFLILDEPFSALDYQTRLNISDEVFKIIKKERKTTIMVTHDISEAISMSDRIIILSKRPAVVKNDVKINFDNSYSSPLLRRKAPNFRIYFNLIWKELDI